MPTRNPYHQNHCHHLYHCKERESYPTLYSLTDHSPPGSSVHGIFQARVLEQVAISYSRGFSQPEDQTCISCVSCIGRWIVYH